MINNIAVNKITAFEDRAEFKDLVDLYYIVEKEKIDLNKILELADKKRVPVPYENLLTINTIGLTGSVSLLKEIKDERLKNFLKYLKETLEVNVKKKVQEAKKGIKSLIRSLLWDYPFNERFLNRNTIPLLMRRGQKLPYPERVDLSEVIRDKRLVSGSVL